MREWSELWKDVFVSSRQERLSFLVFSCGLIGAWSGCWAWTVYQSPAKSIYEIQWKDIAEVKQEKKREYPVEVRAPKKPKKTIHAPQKERVKTASIQIPLNEIQEKELPISEWHIPAFLQKRILRYRDLLGGFYSVNQLSEVYGLKMDLLTKKGVELLVSKPTKCLDIPLISFADLVRHPYFEKDEVRVIFTLRKQEGFHLGQIRDSLKWGDKKWKKVLPYFCQ
ncbi:MAG: competence protein ComEA [Luteibaculaceae bacterium]|jgi:competence protein ComEA